MGFFSIKGMIVKELTLFVIYLITKYELWNIQNKTEL